MERLIISLLCFVVIKMVELMLRILYVFLY
jgi:hypothetical protein